MKINRVFEKQWPQNNLQKPIWRLEYDQNGKIVLAFWDEDVAGRPAPSGEEIDALSKKFDEASAREKIINAARRELAASDWRMTVDKAASMEPKSLEAWKLYRAQLREVVNGERDVLPLPPVDMYGIDSGNGYSYDSDPA